MAKEKIVEIKGIEDYYVSDSGNIYSTKISYRYNPNGEMRPVRPKNHISGYQYAGLFVGKGKTKRRLWLRIHRVVIENFLGNIPNGMEIDHKDGNRTNNNLSNLRMVTRSENMLAMYKRKRKNEKN